MKHIGIATAIIIYCLFAVLAAINLPKPVSAYIILVSGVVLWVFIMIKLVGRSGNTKKKKCLSQLVMDIPAGKWRPMNLNDLRKIVKYGLHRISFGMIVEDERKPVLKRKKV